MKTSLRIRLVVLAGIFTATTVFGQTTYTWTGAADGTNLDTPGNYTTNGVNPAITLPSGQDGSGFRESVIWDGRTSSNLNLTKNGTSWPGGGLGSLGLNFVTTANQTNDVRLGAAPGVTRSGSINLCSITNNSPHASLIIGTNWDSTVGNAFDLITRPGTNGAVHYFVNNSTAPVVFNGSIEWVSGGGVAYTLDFSGPGDFVVNNSLQPDNNPVAAPTLQVDGPGALIWTKAGYNVDGGPSFGSLSGIGLVKVGSKLIVKSAGNFTPDGFPSTIIISNGATLAFDAASLSDTIDRVITGAGSLVMSNGTFTLSGASSYTGNTLLSGGELIVNGAENAGVSGPLGVGGTISFAGGTLGFAPNDVFDYSSRFSTAAGQAYSIDTGGQAVAFTNAAGLNSLGGSLTKLGAGTLTLAGSNNYTGFTIVGAGELVIQGSKTGLGNIIVIDGAALSVYATGTQITPTTLTVGTGAGATLEFENVSSTTTARLKAASVSAGGTIIINVNSGPLVPGNSYPLLSWTSGSAPPVSLGNLNNFMGNLSTNGNRIQLNVTATAYLWTGITDGNWDLLTANDWMQNGAPAVFANGGPVVFDDSSSRTNVTVNAAILPTAVIVTNNVNSYTITSSGANNIGGGASLNKSGSGTLTLAGGANTYSGITTINGGTLSVGALANGGSASDIGAATSSTNNLVFNGGTLAYSGGGANVDRAFTLTMAGGTIDSSGGGALSLNNNGAPGSIGNGARGLTLAGSNLNTNTLVALIADYGGPTALTKSSAGRWILTGTNTYSGGTTIANGLLQIGLGAASGTIGSGDIADNGAIDFNRTGTLTVNGAISGSGSVTNDGGGTVILAADNTYSGGTTINAGILQIGKGGATGKLNSAQPVVDNATLIFNSSSNFTLNGAISGTGSLEQNGSGTLTLNGACSYMGTTAITNGALFINGINTAASTTVYNVFGVGFRKFGGSGTLSGPVTLVGQLTTFAPGPSGSIGTLTVNNNLSFGGNVEIALNKSLAQSNDFVSVSGVLTNTWFGGFTPTLTVTNLGPALVAGDKFTLFNKPLQNGAVLSVTGAGATWANNLAVDGSITVTAVSVPILNFTRTGNSLQFSWNTSFGVFRLQSQTNSLGVGLGTNWSDYPGGGTSPVTVPVDATQGTVFFRLLSAP